jgi:small-conductance mechanosensitive channel
MRMEYRKFGISFIHECQLLSSDIFSLSIWLYMFCIVAICFCLYNYHRRKKKRYLQYNKLFSPPTANWNVLFVSLVISLFLYFFFYLARPTRFYSSWYIRCIIVGCKKTTILFWLFLVTNRLIFSQSTFYHNHAWNCSSSSWSMR